MFFWLKSYIMGHKNVEQHILEDFVNAGPVDDPALLDTHRGGLAAAEQLAQSVEAINGFLLRLVAAVVLRFQQIVSQQCD